MITCELCGKEVKTTQALRGHMTFKHGVTGSNTQQPVARLASEQQLSELENRLGLTEGSTDLLTEQVDKLTEQVTGLVTKVSILSDAVGVTTVTKTTMDAQVEELGKRLTDLRETHNRQATVINEHRDTFDKTFEAVISRIGKVQEMVEDLGEGLNAVRTKLTTHGHDGLSLIPQLSNGLQQVGDEIAELQVGVTKAQALAVRNPTDDFETPELENGSKHTYRVYKGKRGLFNPHRISIDPFFGDKYIDLAEPED